MFTLQNHRSARLLAAAALILLAACSGDDDPTGPGLPEPLPTTTLNLAPEGGAWRVTAPDGSELTVTLPAGAVTGPAIVEVTPEAPREGGLARFRIEAPGLVLREPAVVTLELPDGMPTEVVFAVYGEERLSLLPTTVDPETGLATTRLSLLGLPADPAAKDYLEGATWLDLDLAFCMLDLQFAQEELTRARNDEWYPVSVKDCIDAIEALNHCDDPGIEQLKNLVRQEALQENANARLLAYNTSHDADEDLVRKRIHPLISTNALAAMVGADDQGEVAGPTKEAVDHLLNNYIDNMTELVDNDEYVENTLWTKVWYQLRQFSSMEADAAMLGRVEVEQKLQELQAKNLDQIRRASYRYCRETKQQYMLADIHSGGHLEGQPFHPAVFDVPETANFTGADLIADMHWAVTDLELVAEDDQLPPMPIEGSDRRFAGGEEPGEPILLTSAITVPTKGALVLGGEAWAFTCTPAGDEGSTGWDDQKLVLKLNGDVFDTLSHGGNGRFLEGEKRYLVDEVLEEIGLPTDLALDLELEIFRTSSGCGENYGTDDFLLASLEVYIQPTVDEPEPTLTGNWMLFPGESCAGPIEIVQTGDTFTVTGYVGGQAGCSIPPTHGSGSGTIDGNALTMGMAFSSGYSASFSGTVNAARTAMSGTFNFGGESGTWSAHRPSS